jgi:hypothetical protein
MRFPLGLGLSVLLLAAGNREATAQGLGPLRFGASGIFDVTTLEPIPGGSRKTEFRVEQPMLTLGGEAFDGHLVITSSFSLERLTGDEGALAIGAWGGEFYDRTHPHDYLHEAIVALVGDAGSGGRVGHVAIAAGKGIAPFGSDPAMMRPAIKPPVNEHWTEVADRLLATASARMPEFGLEVAVFDKGAAGTSDASAAEDSSGHNHTICILTCADRGISGSARLTIWPVHGLEIRGSVATLVGGGHHAGPSGTDQRQWNVSARVARPAASGHLTILTEIGQAQLDQSFRTLLAEAEWSSGNRRHRFYYRFERSDRPDGPRSADGQRVVADSQLVPVGITRWTVHTAGYGFAFRPSRLLIEPVVEASFGRVASVGTTFVDLEQLYGRRSVWSFLAGLRIRLGGAHAMGRYGAFSVSGTEHRH